MIVNAIYTRIVDISELYNAKSIFFFMAPTDLSEYERQVYDRLSVNNTIILRRDIMIDLHIPCLIVLVMQMT